MSGSEQTLEQILQEDDDDEFLSELGIVEADVLNIGEETTKIPPKVIEYVPIASSTSKKDPVLLPKPLSRISQVLGSPKLKTEAGFPTCLVVGRLILVGTAHGIILIFDHNQHFKQKLGSPEQCDSVTSLDVAADQDWIAVGHQSGRVSLWDITSGTIIKTLEIHSVPVVHLRFLHECTQIITGDTKGEIYKNTLLYRLMYYSIDSVKLLGGNSGIIYALTCLPKAKRPRTIDNFGLFAISSSKATFVLALSPQMKVVFKLACPESVDPSKQLPYLAWRPSDNNPILAVAWGHFIQLIQVSVKTPGGEAAAPILKFLPFGSPYKARTVIVGMEWIGEQALGYLNQRDEMVALDPFTSSELERMDIRAMELVYHTRYSSEGSLDLCSFHNSICSFNEQFYLLGIQRMYSASVMSWTDRVDLLQREGRWTTALKFCVELYKGKAHAVVGLPEQKAKILPANKIEEILYSKVPQIFEDMEKDQADNNLRLLTANQLATISIETLINVERLGVLFDVIYPIFVSSSYGNVFLELLEPYILQDKLTSLGPAIMQELVHHYRTTGRLTQVEQCIVHLDIGSLDFHQVVTLCRQERLTTALIYMYNSGLHDYLTPFLDLLEMSKKHEEIKPKVLAYLAACLRGKKFPTGELEVSDVPWVKAEALGFIFDTDQNKNTNEQWSRVCFFAQLDTETFIEILGNAFDDPLFSLVNLNDLLNDADKPSWVQFESVIIDHQVLVDCLYECLIDQSSQNSFSNPIASDDWPFTPKQQSYLLCFMAKYFAKGTISLSDEQLNRVFGYLTLSDDPLSLRDREKLLYNIIRTCSPSRYSSEKILLLAEGAKMSKVQELFYLRQKDYQKALEAYLNDKERSSNVFGFIQTMISNPYILPEEKLEIKNCALDNLTRLVKIDSEATSSMIIEYFTQEHGTIWQKLRQHPKLQFKYLRTIMQSSSHTMDELISRKGIEITTDMHESYIKLMCQFAPRDVFPYLLVHTDYRLDYCLSICQHYDILDASTYLLERTGDVSGALEMILLRSNQNISVLSALYSDDGKLKEMENQENELIPSIDVAVMLCKRNSSSLPEEESKALWFQLLDSLVIPMRRVKTTRNRRRGFIGGVMKEEELSLGSLFVTRVFNDCLSKILNNMMGYVPLRVIMEKIVRDHSTAPFSDFKPMILAMLDTNHYEQNILEAAKRLFDSDHFQAHKSFKQKLGRGFKCSRVSSCTLCGLAFTGGCDLMVYSCEHSFHRLCIPENVNSCPACDNILDQIQIPNSGDTGISTLSEEDRYQKYLTRANRFSDSTRVRFSYFIYNS